MREPRALNGLHLVVARNVLSRVPDLVRELSNVVEFLNMAENAWALHGLNWPSPRLILPPKRSQK